MTRTKRWCSSKSLTATIKAWHNNQLMVTCHWVSQWSRIKKFKKKKTREGLNVAAPKLILKFKGLIFAAQHQNHLKWRNNRAARLVSQAVWNEVCQIEVGELIYRSMTSILCFYPPSSACSPLNCIELFFGNEKKYTSDTHYGKKSFLCLTVKSILFICTISPPHILP